VHLDTAGAAYEAIDLRGMLQLKNSTTEEVRVKSAVSLLLLAVGILLALILAWLGRVILLLLFAAIVVAASMSSVVNWLGARLRLGAKTAFATILVLAVGAVLLVIWLSGPNIIDQFANLQMDLPRAANQLIERVNGYGWGRWLLAEWSGYSQLSSNVSSAMTRIGGIVLSTATLLSGMVIVVILGLYLAAEPKVYFEYFQRVTPSAYKLKLDMCAAAAVRNLRFWVLSRLLSMSSIGILVAGGLLLLGVPLAGILGLIAALLTFIPNIGAILSVVPAFLLAVAIDPTKGLLTVLLFMFVHFIEGNLITPLLEREIVRLPPALTMTAQLLMAVIAGPLGLTLAAPLAAVGLGVFDVLVPKQSTSSQKSANSVEGAVE